LYHPTIPKPIIRAVKAKGFLMQLNKAADRTF